MITKIKNFCKEYEKDLVLAIIVILTALIGFGLGRLSKLRENKTPITIENLGASVNKVEPWGIGAEDTKGKGSTLNNTSGVVVASKNGAKYHYPWCSGAQSIKEENKIWFSSEEKAREAGYTPASNCKGLK
jgi:hypothetical protein